MEICLCATTRESTTVSRAATAPPPDSVNTVWAMKPVSAQQKHINLSENCACGTTTGSCTNHCPCGPYPSWCRRSWACRESKGTQREMRCHCRRDNARCIVAGKTSDTTVVDDERGHCLIGNVCKNERTEELKPHMYPLSNQNEYGNKPASPKKSKLLWSSATPNSEQVSP